MKKWLLLLNALVFAIVTSTSQNSAPYSQKIEDRIEAQRIAFLTTRLKLTPEEAQGFWPVYNDYRDREKSLKEEKRPDKALEGMSEGEASDYIVNVLDIEMKELVLKRDFFNNLKNVLPSKKIVLLEQAEHLFKERLLNYMSQQRNRIQQNRPRNH